MNRINELESVIKKHDELYWSKGTPEISDSAYDKLVEELRNLDPENKVINKINTPEVSGEGKVKHINAMLSLDKKYSSEELIAWAEKVARSDNELFNLMIKYDGCSGEIAGDIWSTRGDGTYGENITHIAPICKCVTFADIDRGYKEIDTPKELEYGEIVILKSDFIKYKHLLVRKDGTPYKNERNAVGGIMSRDDITFTDKVLSFIPFSSNITPLTVAEMKMIDWNITISNVQNSDIPADGMVLKLADEDYGDSLGVTSHHRKSMMALKFENSTGNSKLIGIEWSVGKHVITPVGIITPVEISGVTVTHVNLHNMKYIIDNDIQLYDDIVVERAGDVIPDYVSSTRTELSEVIEAPPCIACDSVLVYNEPSLECPNNECPGKHLRCLMDSVTRIGIERLGEPTVKAMMEKLEVKTLVDILNLTEEHLLILPRFAEKKANNLFNEIQKVKNDGAFDWQILASLNIQGIGRSLSKTILEGRTLSDLFLMSYDELNAIEGVGPERSKILIDGLRSNADYLMELKSVLPSKTSWVEPIEEGAINICFTGKFPEKKSTYYDMLKTKGGYIIMDKVNKETQILVVADPSKGSNKQKKAEKLGVQVLGINELVQQLNN